MIQSIRGGGRTLLALVLATLALMWPAFVNGQPFLMSDTTTYVRAADAAVYKLTDRQTDWSDELLQRFRGHVRAEDVPATPAATAAAPSQSDVVLLGRSIYYGALLYFADATLSLWAVAGVQAFLVALCIWLTTRRLWPGSSTRPFVPFLVLAVLIAVVTPAAFFASFLMPDIFVALAIVAAAHLAVWRDGMVRREKLFWLGVICAAALFHSANILILSVLLTASLFLLRDPLYERLRTVAPMAAALLIGIAGELLFSAGVTWTTGSGPIRPPFVSARLIADGPGLRYLDEHCPEKRLALCDYRSRMPHHSDTFLWSPEADKGVFSAVEPDEKRRIAAEDLRFATAVLIDRPVEVIVSSFGAIIDQAGKFRLSEFNYDPDALASFDEKLPDRLGSDLSRTAAAKGQMPVRATEILTAVSVLGSAFLAVLLVMTPGMARTSKLFVVIILIGVALDIIVCGALSTPHDRYSARVLWIIVLALLPTAAAVIRRRASAGPRRYAVETN